MLLLFPVSVSADSSFYYDKVINTGKDNGYSGENSIGLNDPHFGWKLGRFNVTGFSSLDKDNDGNPVFLKNVGDEVKLSFHLEQDIDKLAGKTNLSINQDGNGYDDYFGVLKQDFGRGTLITRLTDYKNYTDDAIVYTDYLAGVTADANTAIITFEEGDYEVALNYEIKDVPWDIRGFSIFPKYTNYRIFFRFSVRNSNAMVFPMDLATGSELKDMAITENGFSLDLAKSQYLRINVLMKNLDGDTRINRAAREGDKYTEEGVYTITVANQYTNSETTKTIYVGTNKLLKAMAKNDLTLTQVKDQLDAGATINDNGVIKQPPNVTIEPTATATATPTFTPTATLTLTPTATTTPTATATKTSIPSSTPTETQTSADTETDTFATEESLNEETFAENEPDEDQSSGFPKALLIIIGILSFIALGFVLFQKQIKAIITKLKG
jgi:hypothetical protein